MSLPPLLHANDPAPVGIARLEATSPFVLVCDHAGKHIPRGLNQLGLPEHERARHIAWDIGALGVARELSALLDAALVWQNYSRLVIDCNRPQTSPELIPERSESTAVPGNHGLADAARRERIQRIYAPYHDAIKSLLDERQAARRDTIFISIHSFTPIYHGVHRPWHIGVLHGPDSRLSERLLQGLASYDDVCVGVNQPYKIDGKDHSIPEHALARHLPNVLFEIRQDLLIEHEQQKSWAKRLASLLKAAAAPLLAMSQSD